MHLSAVSAAATSDECRYLAYIFLYHGDRALNTHVYPQHWRKYVRSRTSAFATYLLRMQLCLKRPDPTLSFVSLTAGQDGRKRLHTFQLSYTRQQTWIRMGITCLLAILMA